MHSPGDFLCLRRDKGSAKSQGPIRKPRTSRLTTTSVFLLGDLSKVLEVGKSETKKHTRHLCHPVPSTSGTAKPHSLVSGGGVRGRSISMTRSKWLSETGAGTLLINIDHMVEKIHSFKLEPIRKPAPEIR